MAHKIGYTGITLVIKEKEKEKLKRLAKKEGTSVSSLGRKILVEWATEQTKRPKTKGEAK